MNIQIYRYDTVPSTNTLAKEMIKKGVTEGVITADRQSAGRGRLGRSFFSENGLFMSILLAPEKMPFAPSFLTSAVAAAVCRSICDMGVSVQVKWVNDIYYQGKKACGILTEAVTNGSIIQGYVVGIGINLENGNFPPELADIATTLPLPLSEKETILKTIYREVQTVLTKAPQDIVAYLTEKSAVLGKPIHFFGSKEGYGTAISINKKGELEVKTDEGETIFLSTGEISVRIQK